MALSHRCSVPLPSSAAPSTSLDSPFSPYPEVSLSFVPNPAILPFIYWCEIKSGAQETVCLGLLLQTPKRDIKYFNYKFIQQKTILSVKNALEVGLTQPGVIKILDPVCLGPAGTRTRI